MTSHPHACALSFVIPLYNSALTIANLVHTIELLAVEGGHEVVLVNDGSADNTRDVCLGLVRSAKIPIVYIEHARNFGEHNAVLTGWRNANGAYVVNLDDDGQNPPEEAVRLWHHARQNDLDVAYGHYGVKQHSWFRNVGSSFTNWMTDWALDKPHGFYLSSFRCVSAFITHRVVDYAGPYPYIDGLLLQVTQRIGSITVRHDARRAGESGYTFRRLGHRHSCRRRIDLHFQSERHRPLRRVVADHRALPRRDAERLDVVLQNFFERQGRVVVVARRALAAHAEDDAFRFVEDAGELERRQHAIDAVEVFLDVFEKKNRA
jgi:glycosyltransferase involved in cell wall biosynthesis